MKITIEKGAGADVIRVVRSDGSKVSTSFPHKGPVPHDAVHFFVERELGIEEGFWGLVAGGLHPEQVAALAKAAGHASASRAGVPEPSIVAAIQAERIVECFEADLWGGGADADTFRDAVRAGCEQSCVPAPRLDDQAIARITQRIAEFRDLWVALRPQEKCSLEWPLA